MRPELRQVTPTQEYSFIVRKDIDENMITNWHYHPEIELLFFSKCAGTWMVGDHIGHFQSGDVILIGAHLPHCFRFERKYIKGKETAREAICVKFLREILPGSLLNLPETRSINDLLPKARHGLQLMGETKKKAGQLITLMQNASPGKRLIYLLSILDQIEESKEYAALSSSGFIELADYADHKRLKNIFEYTFRHYNEAITIGKIASLLNMTRQSFCRYFKKKTGKTFIRFLMEVRIGHACKLLVERDLNVSEICYSSGYNNISHFNHQFKMITKKTPLGYKRYYYR
jgi:AraC-like DNA-binding protein